MQSHLRLPNLCPPPAPNDIGLVARFHFATHTKDFDKAREFYRMLGYTNGRGGFPLTNTHQMARALGMFDICQYELVKGEVISLPGSLNAANIGSNPTMPIPRTRHPSITLVSTESLSWYPTWIARFRY